MLNWYDWHTVNERLQGRLYALTRGKPFRLRLDPKFPTGYCDLENKVVGINPVAFNDVFTADGLDGDELDEANFLMSRALTGHEALHTEYTDATALREACHNTATKHLWNILEDARIEGIGAESSHVSRLLFKLLKRSLVAEMPNFSDPNCDDPASWFYLLMSWRCGLRIPEISDEAKKIWRQVRTMAESSLYARDSWEVLNTAREIAKITGVGKRRPKSQMQKDMEDVMDKASSGMNGSSKPKDNPRQKPEKKPESDDAGDTDDQQAQPDSDQDPQAGNLDADDQPADGAGDQDQDSPGGQGDDTDGETGDNDSDADSDADQDGDTEDGDSSDDPDATGDDTDGSDSDDQSDDSQDSDADSDQGSGSSSASGDDSGGQGDDDTTSGQDTDDDQDQSDTAGSQGTDDDTDADPDEDDGDVMEDLKDLLKSVSDQVRDKLSDVVPHGDPKDLLVAGARNGRHSPVIAAPYIDLLDRALPIAQAMERELKGEAPKASVGPSRRAGRFKTRYYVRDNEKPFAQKKYRGMSTPEMALSLVLDRSVSMKENIDDLRVMAMAIYLVCERLGIPLSIWVLEGEVHLKRFDEWGPHVLAKIAGIIANTYTDMMPTISDACTDLMRRPEELKQVILIHDGSPGDTQEVTAWSRQISEFGLFCMYIMPQHQYEQTYTPNRRAFDEIMTEIFGSRRYAIAKVKDMHKHWCSYMRTKRKAYSVPV